MKRATIPSQEPTCCGSCSGCFGNFPRSLKTTNQDTALIIPDATGVDPNTSTSRVVAPWKTISVICSTTAGAAQSAIYTYLWVKGSVFKIITDVEIPRATAKTGKIGIAGGGWGTMFVNGKSTIVQMILIDLQNRKKEKNPQLLLLEWHSAPNVQPVKLGACQCQSHWIVLTYITSPLPIIE